MDKKSKWPELLLKLKSQGEELQQKIERLEYEYLEFVSDSEPMRYDLFNKLADLEDSISKSYAAKLSAFSNQTKALKAWDMLLNTASPLDLPKLQDLKEDCQIARAKVADTESELELETKLTQYRRAINEYELAINTIEEGRLKHNTEIQLLRLEVLEIKTIIELQSLL